jgi:hypothetical protein
MSMKTQGTDMFTVDPANGQVLTVGCVTSIDGIDTTLDQIEDTCLNSPVRTYVAGLATPGSATFGINADPRDDSHIRLHQLKVAGVNLPWAIGWSDGTAAPTAVLNSEGEYEFVTPTDRSWLVFEGFMNSFPFSFAQNSVVQSTVGIQVSGEPEWIPAAT